MADKKIYYYMRLKENFFEGNELAAIEAMPDGFLYSNILLKMYLKSLRDEGRLMIGAIPYDAEMIAGITHHKVKTVKKALELFEKVGLIEVLDNGAIYMLDIQNFIGKASTEADRKRKQRARIETEKRDICLDECPTNLHQRLEYRE